MARRDMPRWVISALALWGRQKRRVWIGKDWHGNVDGYAQSLLGRIREEQILAANEGRLMPGESVARPVAQRWLEVFWGAGLDVQRGIVGMREIPYAVLHLHYVFLPEWQLTVAQKAEWIGITTAEYWRELENAENWTHAKLDSTSDCQPSEKLLHVPIQSATTCIQSAKVAKVSLDALNLAALNRPKLKLAR
jgi:hypothetical protein